MNKLFTLLALSVLFIKPLNAQISNDDVGIALGLTALTIASAIEVQKQYEEDLEYHAVNYVLDKL